MNFVGRHKLLAALLGLILLTLLIGALTKGGTPSNSKTDAAQSTVSSASKPVYRLVGVFGPQKNVAAVVVNPAVATETGLTAIGRQLDAKYGAASLMSINVYTDQKQARIFLKDPLQPATLTGVAAKTYKKAFVAQYALNKSAKTKTYTIYLDGTSKVVTL
jgi:hypothetical protein